MDPDEANQRRKFRRVNLQTREPLLNTNRIHVMHINPALARDNRRYRKAYLDAKKRQNIVTAAQGASSTTLRCNKKSRTIKFGTAKENVNPNYQGPHVPMTPYIQNSNNHSRTTLSTISNVSPLDALPSNNNTRSKYKPRTPLTTISSSDENANHNSQRIHIPNTHYIPDTTNHSPTPLSTISKGTHTSVRSTITPILYSRINSTFVVGETSTNPPGCIESTGIRLSPGKHKLRRKTTNTVDIPLFDLTIDEDDNNEDNMAKSMYGISKEYNDHGDQNQICGVCRGKLWKAEAKHSEKRPNRSFSLCCMYGKVELPDYKDPPHSYKNLFCSSNSTSKFFLKNIRRYNSMFAFTSMGGKVDHSINRGRGPPIFRISGENYHRIGSLLPTAEATPKFSQLYIYDTENEIANRQQLFKKSDRIESSNDVSNDFDIINYLKSMLDEHNSLVQSYRMVRDCFHANPQVQLSLRIIGKRVHDGRTYNLPTASEVAVLIVGDISGLSKDRDILVQTSSGELQRINELHPSYLALQYPLLFPYGDDGYSVDILHRGLEDKSQSKRPNLTMREFFAYRIQDRAFIFSLIHNSRRLFQQFLVDAYSMIESERLYYIKKQQSKLRCSTYENLKNFKQQGNTTANNVGQRMILPSSFTGGARYMQQNYLDAMSICKWFGYPDFFITITCNPKWPEINRFLNDTNLKPEDRPDILCRLFKIKLDSMIKDLKDKSLLGKVQAVVYTIEFQKRGLPHSHICLFMHTDSKIPSIDLIELYISAELPDINGDPELHSLVTEFMLHGPCGDANPKCPCMVDNKCSKKFPKKFSDHHTVDADGYPIYRRRDDGSAFKKFGYTFDNRSVVPYNKVLLKRYQAHINVEWCNQASSIKYLFKYINKWPNRATVAVVQTTAEGTDGEVVDEIKNYYDCRYISACEATWRIFGYDVHYRTPSVVRLPFHLPDKQHVVYNEYDHIDNVLEKPSVSASMFLGWMECNQLYAQARELTYVEFPTTFVWKQKSRKWEFRQGGFSIGRIHAVSPNLGEAYFLRILLNKVKGPRSFEEIRTVNGHIHPTFRDACYALGLLDDDKEYVECIIEASLAGSGFYLRNLFATMLNSNSLSQPELVWEQTWRYLADGILYKQRNILKSPDLTLTDEQLHNLTLFEIEIILNRNGSTLKKWNTMPFPDEETVASSNNRLILDELAYNITTLLSDFTTQRQLLTTEQSRVFEEIITSIEHKNGGVFFVYGYGGTGKTFLWKTLYVAIRSKGDIVLNVASSGIAALLLDGGRTAHSRFRIPFVLNEDSLCYIEPGTDIARLLKKTALIIWDEAPMTHRHAFEALDRSLKDIMRCEGDSNAHLPFGGKVIVFGGDFCQILPVVTGGTRQDIVNASLSSSYIWQYCKILKLTKNMRLSVGSHPSTTNETAQFAKWLLDIGEGNVGDSTDGAAVIDIPHDILIPQSNDPTSALIDFVYPSLVEHYKDLNYFHERAILAPKNKVVHDINDRLLQLFPGEEKEYFSSDSLCQVENLPSAFDKHLYSPDVLNRLDVSGLPKHRLVLKVGVPVMLLRNIDQKEGLCNGTRLQIVSLGTHVIEAVVLTGRNIGHRTFIPRFSLKPSDKKIPYAFKRRQFPISVCFAMTINKSQGQSLSRVGLFLQKPVFTHGQLYVALSRVTSREGLKILILEKDGSVKNTTSNVVYKEVFDNLY